MLRFSTCDATEMVKVTELSLKSLTEKVSSRNYSIMTETDPKSPSPSPPPPPPPPSSSSSTGLPTESTKSHSNNHRSNGFSGQKIHYPNPPDAVNPDAATLREQWKFAIRQYSRWYSHAWGTAILAGAAFFALGWVIKGGNPLPSFRDEAASSNSTSSDAEKNSR